MGASRLWSQQEKRCSPKARSALLRGVVTALLGPSIFAAEGAAWGQKLLGANVHQSLDVGHNATADAGLHWVRIDLNWFQCEPSQGSYDFALLDGVVDAAKARGLEVLAVIAYGPAWASMGDTKADGPTNDVPMNGAYPSFVAAAVAHFQDRVTHYEIWNEPNLGDFFEGTKEDYVNSILVPGAQAVHTVCPSCKVVAPGLASIAGEYDLWMDASLAAAKDQIDIVSGHIYSGFPVDSPGVGSTTDSFFNKLESHRVLETNGTIVFEGPLSFREIMQKNGVSKPFWLTETGRTATLGDGGEEAGQALFYRRTLEAMLVRPWWEATFYYEAFDEPASGYEWGMVVSAPSEALGYKPKAVFQFLQTAIQEVPGLGGNKPECDDGIDDDGDGFSDYPEDPDCSSVLDPGESGPLGMGGAGGQGGQSSQGGSSGGGENGGGSGPGMGATGGDAEPIAGCSCSALGIANSPNDWALALLLSLGLIAKVRRKAQKHRQT